MNDGDSSTLEWMVEVIPDDGPKIDGSNVVKHKTVNGQGVMARLTKKQNKKRRK